MRKIFSKKKLLLSLCTLTMATCSVASLAFLDKTTASATTAQTFEMMGASIRTADPDGIRFIAKLETQELSSYGEGAKYGMMLIPEDMETDTALTVTYEGGTYAASNPEALVIEGGDFWSEDLRAANGIASGYSAFSCALLADQGDGDSVVNFPEQFYNRPISAVAFIIPESGETVYTSKVTRSVSYVAAVERLKPTYEENEVVERVASKTTCTLGVNDGETLENLLKAYTPDFMIGGTAASTSSAVSVTYTSSAPEIAKIVDGKVQPVADGTATITATAAIGEKSVSATTEIKVDVTKEIEWVVLNDASGDFMDYCDGSVTSAQSTAADSVGAGYVKATANQDWGWFYLPVKEDGKVLKARALQEKFTQFKFRVYVPSALEGDIYIPAGVFLPAGTATGWHEVVLSVEQMTTNYNDVAGLIVQFRLNGQTVYFDDVLGLTSGPNYKPEQLEAPTVEIWEDGTVTWNEVEGATAYAYYSDGLTATVTNETSIKLNKKSSVKVKALGDGAYYKDSKFSNVVTYVKQDMLNDCEVATADKVEGLSGTVEASSDFFVEGTQSIKATVTGGAETNGFMALLLYFKRDGVPVTLAQLKAYDHLEMTVHAKNDARIFFYNAELGLLGAGETRTFEISSAVIEAQAAGYIEETGRAHIQVQTCEDNYAPATIYVDNVVGVYSDETVEGSSTKVLNDASIGFAAEHNFRATTSISTAEDPVGAGYPKAVATEVWATVYLPFKEKGVTLTTAQLQAKYTSFTFSVYIDGNYGLDIPTRNIAAGAGWHDVTIQASELSEINVNNFQNYNDAAGLFLSMPSAGETFYVGEVTGHKKVVSSSINFGNSYIIGDSYSTYEGWIPLDEYAFYSDYDAALYNVEDTWWHKLLTATGSNLVYNDSLGGTTISYTGYDGLDYTSISFLTRFEEMVASGYFEENHVDTVFIFGGTNDAWAGAPIGEPKYSGWTTEDKYQVCPALCCLINTVRYHLPNVKIVVLGNVWGYQLNNSAPTLSDKMAEIATFYKQNGFNIDYIPVTLADSDIVSNHPNVSGMQKISDAVLNYYN